MDILETIIELSHEFGTGSYVQGGGGNSSVKDGDTIWVKPSGTTLVGLKVEELLELDRGRIGRIYEMDTPEGVKEREDLVTRLLAEAKRNPDDERRPSVESPLHDSFDARYVVHTHPQLVGGMVCAHQSAEVAARLFPRHLYTPSVDPGYTVSMSLREEIARYRARAGVQPDAVFMENHGLVVAGDTADEVRSVSLDIMDTLKAEYEKAGVSTVLDIGPEPDPNHVADVIACVQESCDPEHTVCTVVDGCFTVPPGPLSPDHIVYMKSYPFLGVPSAGALQEFVAENGYSPRAVVTDQAVVCFGSTPNNARLAMDMAKDGALVAQLAEAFGGARFMSDDRRIFVEEWEAETYRQKIGS